MIKNPAAKGAENIKNPSRSAFREGLMFCKSEIIKFFYNDIFILP